MRSNQHRSTHYLPHRPLHRSRFENHSRAQSDHALVADPATVIGCAIITIATGMTRVNANRCAQNYKQMIRVIIRKTKEDTDRGGRRCDPRNLPPMCYR
ncbi:unnamed protein product [Arctia plantaginis]|uniref:Uncharacterized protein n=1 Tax=Arctia plantaginis TaxID=874455 RepID=A0A8S1B7I9_ARCPL|nr:unnamed protein product [Arctia plantaginis]CAB3254849.1 unnamed protein product [Arctia plantaginis]